MISGQDGVRIWVATGMLLGAGVSAPAQEAPATPGGAFNLRIVSDSVPDWSSRENFVRSALSGWAADHEKALAQFRWSYRCRRVGSYVAEDSRPVVDPILFFNSYGITFCTMISYMNCGLWEAWGKPSRLVTLSYHCVAEVQYGGAWHLFDNDFCNYFLNEKGEVASAEELAASRIHGNVKDLKPGEFYVFDHCPTASFPRGRIFMGPSSWSLIDIARDWYPNTDIVKSRPDVTLAQAGHRYILGLRPDETYTRHWRPLGTGELYARLFRDEKDPAADGSTLKNNRSNGEWSWRPDVSNTDTLFASDNVESTKDGIKPKDPAKPASAVFRVMAANVVTSAKLDAQFAGDVRFTVSGDTGLNWEPVALRMEEAGGGTATISSPLAGRLEYLLRVELPPGGVLKGLSLKTITQVNPRTLPALRLGPNEVVAVSDGHQETVRLAPRLAEGRHVKEVVNAKGWQVIESPADQEPALRGKGDAEIILRAVTPRAIQRVRMGCTAFLMYSDSTLALSAQFDGGTNWQVVGKQEYRGAPYDHRPSFETRQVPAGARGVKLRYAIDHPANGLSSVLAEVGYEPAGPFMPYDVTYCWSEFRGGAWVERRHTERVKDAYHFYAINVGGERPPRMNWLRVSPAGAEKPGYNDGEDVGDKAGQRGYALKFGKALSTGCSYEVSRPASAAFPDSGGKLLSDGYVGLASFWGLENINLTGKKNEKRAGELAVWEPGNEVVVTVDLGRLQAMGGARICAVQPNQSVLYPAEMTVEVSADGKEFTPTGKAVWQDCFFPPGDFPVWEGADSPIYDHLPAGGITDHKFAILFKDRPTARFVRFRLAPPADPKAGIGLWELEVYDRMEKLPWSERLKMPERPGDLERREPS